ncbi:MAG: hypothetical protein N2316_07160 [Spirochaetes bacterium]|nr:hypothetical protein [Spirochaetota bacterium]
MGTNKLNWEQTFELKHFRQNFLITWAYVSIAIAIFLLFVFLAGFLPARNFFYYLIQNVGIFLAFTVVLAGYSAIFGIVNSPQNALRMENVKWTLKNFHYFLGISLAFIIIFLAIVFVEIGISAISYIPLVGPAIITLLTIPLFFVNFICILCGVCLFVVFPLLVWDLHSIKETVKKLKRIFQHKWLYVLCYAVVSISILLLAMQLIFYLIRYAAGITKAAQWQIHYALPEMVNRLGMSSLFTDILSQIFPRPQTVSPATYSVGFVNVLKYIIGISYTIVFSFIATFPLTMYFLISSQYIKNIWQEIEEKSIEKEITEISNTNTM